MSGAISPDRDPSIRMPFAALRSWRQRARPIGPVREGSRRPNRATQVGAFFYNARRESGGESYTQYTLSGASRILQNGAVEVPVLPTIEAGGGGVGDPISSLIAPFNWERGGRNHNRARPPAAEAANP